MKNALVSLSNVVCEALQLGMSVGLAEISSLRLTVPSEMMDTAEEVTVKDVLKTPKIVFMSKQIYFITTTVVDWVDIYTRSKYKYTVLDSLAYCQQWRICYLKCSLQSNNNWLRRPSLRLNRDCAKVLVESMVVAFQRFKLSNNNFKLR